MENLKSILLVKMSSIGDVVMSTPVAESVRKAYPDAYIGWLVEEKCRDVVIGNPYLDEVFVWSRTSGIRSLRSAREVIRRMRARRFDVAIDFQGLAKSAIMTYLSGAALRIGYADCKEHNTFLYNKTVECGVWPHRMRCHRLLLEPIGIQMESVSPNMLIPLSDEHTDRSLELLIAHGVLDRDNIVVLVPATTFAFKHWIEDRWASVADELWTRLGLIPVFLGGKGDVELIERIRARAKTRTVSLVGQTTWAVAAATAKRARLTVAVDTGLMHSSVAVGTPTIALYGPTPEWKEHVSRPNFKLLMKEFPCAPCRPRRACEGFDCMKAITVEDVVAAAEEILIS